MQTTTLGTALLVVSMAIYNAHAQHCAPISESYLTGISVKRSGEATLKLRCEYAKTGGQHHPKYQAYVLAFLDKDADKVPGAAPKELLDPEKMLVLHTQVIERTKDGTYELEYAIDENDLAQKVIKHAGLTAKDRGAQGWSAYHDHVRLAVFIPWLEDKQYATHPALPAERHECNYGRTSALLFQKLPYSLRMVHESSEKCHIHINADKPAPPAKE